MLPIPKGIPVMFFSTRNAKMTITASEALLQGLAPDGGLFLSQAIVPCDPRSLIGKTYPEMAYLILRPYFDDFSDDEIKEAVEQAYSSVNFPKRFSQPKPMTPIPSWNSSMARL
jgi:threonine synthase